MTTLPTILKTIIARKTQEVAQRQLIRPLADVMARAQAAVPTRGFMQAIQHRLASQKPAVIAEIKKASPSQGVIREDFDPVAIAKSYAAADATCLSVLTDIDFFQGQDSHLQAARAACHLPVLRKDFIIDPYQVYETRALGADCLLLIAAALDDVMLTTLYTLAQKIGLDVLVEIHNRVELTRALTLKPQLLGINNRDLHSFKVDLNHTLELLPAIPPSITLITESGINTPADVKLMRDHHIHAFLVGESFMRATDPGLQLKALFL